jgi:hypothetical protein
MSRHITPPPSPPPLMVELSREVDAVKTAALHTNSRIGELGKRFQPIRKTSVRNSEQSKNTCDKIDFSPVRNSKCVMVRNARTATAMSVRNTSTVRSSPVNNTSKVRTIFSQKYQCSKNKSSVRNISAARLMPLTN